MNIQKVALTHCKSRDNLPSNGASFGNTAKSAVSRSVQNLERPFFSADSLIKGTVVGGVLGAIFSRDGKSAAALGWGALKGVGIVLGALTVFKFVSVLINSHRTS